MPDIIVKTPNIFFNILTSEFTVILLDSSENIVKINPIYNAANISTCFAL